MNEQAWEVATVIEDAADLIERDGWFNTRGVGEELPSPQCAVTAVASVARSNRSGLHAQAMDALIAYVGGSATWDIALWNNAFDDPQPVLDGMRECAAQLRATA